VVDSQRLLLTAENPEEVAKKLESEVRFVVFFWCLLNIRRKMMGTMGTSGIFLGKLYIFT
jgi:hypothetical protein